MSVGLHGDAKVAEYTEAGFWGHETWHELLSTHASERGDRMAVCDPLNFEALTGLEPRELTWSELAAYVDELAQQLSAAGIRAGHVVGVQLPNGVALTASLLAITRIGAIAMPFAMQLGKHEIAHMGAVASMRGFIGAARFGEHAPLDSFLAYRDEQSTLGPVLGLGDPLPDGVLPLVGESADLPPAPSDSNECVTICLTSGTESAPKGVQRCMNDWRPMALASVDAADLGPDDVLLNPFPMVNMAGIAGMFLPWLLTGSRLVHHHPFDPQVLFGQLARYQATYTVAPPALLMLVLARDDIPAAVFGSLKVIGSGSAPLAPAMTNGWTEKFGIEVINAFGSNEGACIAGDPVTVPDRTDRARLFPRFGSPDHTWPNRGSHGMQTRIVGAAGEVVDTAGAPGELRVKGPGVFAGYIGNTATDPFDEDGYYRTGDVFEYVADDSGDLRYLRYVDRMKDIVVRGGQNISTAEVESLLAAHPSIAEAAVIGIPDDVLGERACAFVVPAGEPPTMESIRDHLVGLGVASFKMPERIEIVEALPRNAVGKILKRNLRPTVGTEADA